MKCPKCNFVQNEGTECIHCGIVFKKYLMLQREHASDLAKGIPDTSAVPDVSEVKGNPLFQVKPEIDFLQFSGRILILMGMLLWGFSFVFSSIESNYAGSSFMHLANLPFHEAGHIIFSCLGRFMAVLGGSLMQILIPLLCFGVFLLKTKDSFAASVALWWAGESFIDLAPYINDARDLNLTLLGGVTGKDVDDYHDWEFILRQTGLLEYDHFFAKAVHMTGALVISLACFWGGLLLLKQFRIMRPDRRDA